MSRLDTAHAVIGGSALLSTACLLLIASLAPDVSEGSARSHRPRSVPQQATAATIDTSSDLEWVGRIIAPGSADAPLDVASDLPEAFPAAEAANMMPVVTVRGIAGGPPWYAIASSDGRDHVLSAGDSLRGIHVVAVTRERVVVVFRGDSVVLTPWPLR